MRVHHQAPGVPGWEGDADMPSMSARSTYTDFQAKLPASSTSPLIFHC